MAISTNPNYTRAYRQLGDFYYHVGSTNEAEKTFKRLKRISPDCAESVYGEGICFLIAGNRSKALSVYTRLKPMSADLAALLFSHIYE